jgi:ligand-binding SRPBCC domain-containing protein
MDIDLHIKSTTGTNERAVSGVTTGLISLGEEVTWEARHFGVTQKLTSQITAFDRPSHFRDSQVRGSFARFDHDHFLKTDEGATIMLDVFDYDSPFGVLVSSWVLTNPAETSTLTSPRTAVRSRFRNLARSETGAGCSRTARSSRSRCDVSN